MSLDLRQGVRVPELGLYPEVSRFFGPYWYAVEDKRPVFRVTRDGARFALFCARMIRHTKGRWAGQPFVLEPWEVFAFSEMLRTVDEERDGTFIELGVAEMLDPLAHLHRAVAAQAVEPMRSRVYQEAYMQLSKKNGKSGIATAFGLFMVCADGEVGAEVYAAASAKDQAKIVHGQARKVVRASPVLSRFLKVYRDAIEDPASGSVFRVISADAGVNEGLEPHAFIGDEIHRHKNRELWDTLSKGTVSRARPLGLGITNAGADEDTICGELYGQAKAVRDGQPGARSDLYCFFPELPEKDLDPPRGWTVRDPIPDATLERWKAVNPASWITKETLERERRKSPRFVFLRFNLNRWTRAEESWLPAGAWDACRGNLEPDSWQEGITGVDLGSSHDSTGIALVFPLGLDDEGKLIADVTGWTLQAHPDPEKPPPLAHEVVDGDRVPIALVEKRLEVLADEHELDALAFDPWRFARSAELLEPVFYDVVEFPQTNERMCPASQALFDAILEGRLRHDGDEILAAHIAAAVARDTERGWRLQKLRSKKPQDFAIALAVAWAEAEARVKTGDVSVTVL